MVEAKQSSPQPARDTFDRFIAEIVTKFIHAFSLTIAACLKRHTTVHSDLPESFRKLPLNQINFHFVLVMRGYPESWLDPLRDALQKELRPWNKVWALKAPSVTVCNEDLARRHGLIVT